ncbi:MAG: NAD(P)(+) transhydrogenase (Re/Si-specific) subunit beta, partial [Gammaproteobacteria bacterium]
AKQVFVIKRGQGKGYSGVENELFFQNNTNMVYGDAQKVMVAMTQAVKSLEGGH